MPAYININIAAKVFISFNPLNVDMIREELNTIPVTISYSNGTGQTLPNGTVLSYGTQGQANFTQLTFTSGVTFNDTGTTSAVITSTPGQTVTDQAVTFTVDGSTITVNIDYNSRPEVENIDLDMIFAQTRTFTLNDFTDSSQGNYQDFDGDTLSEVMIEGDLNGYFYPSPLTPLPSSTWIPIANISAGQLTFKGSTAQIAGYSKSNPYKVKDSEGVISN